MTEESTVLKLVDQPMHKPLQEYAELVKEVAGVSAKALTFFGAVVSGSFDRHRHSARSVLIVDRIDLSVLRRLAEHGVKLGKAGITAPLIMTLDYISTSLDTFPLEFIEIQQRHATIFGEDHFDDLVFQNAHVRLQCERELKVILIGLRQGLLAAAGREKVIGALEMDVAEGLMRTLRGLLWLKGQKEARPAVEVVAAVEKLADRRLPGITTALDPTARHGWSEFEGLYRDVEAIGEVANEW